MSRRDFVKHLNRHGCELLREGSEHAVYTNSAKTKTAAVPRHNEIKPSVVRAICKALGIAAPRGR